MDAQAFYSSREWRDLRERRLAADGSRCTIARLLGDECDGPLHVHHVRPVSERPDLALDFGNTATACARHHAVWEGIRRRALRELPKCRHVHRYRAGREECERRRRAALVAGG